MAVSLLLILILAVGGMPLTYLAPARRPLMWRLAAGFIIACAVFGTLTFVGASVFGLTLPLTLGALLVSLMPLGLLVDSDRRRRLRSDWDSATAKLNGVNAGRLGSFAYYALFLLVFLLFFSQSIYQTPAGIFTGGSQNLGDLPYHLGAIFSFTDGGNFPPQNPSFAGARFSYPFIADLLTAAFMRLGADVVSAMCLQNTAWAFALLVVFEGFVLTLTANRLAARLAPPLLFLSGGLGFAWFANDYLTQGKGIWEFLWSLPRDYTIGEDFRWGNSLVVLFITQRSLLFGMPLTLIVLTWLWRLFSPESGTDAAHDRVEPPVYVSLGVGLLAGMLPLIHLHSLAVLFVVTAFLFAMRPAAWKHYLAFGAGVSIVAIPELLWTMSGSATDATEFFGWNFGWDKRDNNILWFWLKNTGLAIPAVVAAIWLSLEGKADGQKPSLAVVSPRVIMFYIPFAFLFIVSNALKLAPWQWDNIKVLIYWFVCSAVLIAALIAWMWTRGALLKAAAVIISVSLCLSGLLDVWRTASGQNKINVFDADAVRIAELIKQRTEPDALFLNAPTYNSAVVLSGRPSYMRYSGHLLSHGIDYSDREDEVRRIYSGAGVAEILMSKAGIDYVLVSPEERTSLGARDDAFNKYPVVAESGNYRVFKVK